MRVAIGKVVASCLIPSLRLAPSSCVMSVAGMETLEKLPGIANTAAPGLLSTTTTANAPIACACNALSANGQVPRSTTAMLPFTGSELFQTGSQPSVGTALTSDVLMLSAILSAKFDCALAYMAHARCVPKMISAAGWHGSNSPANNEE